MKLLIALLLITQTAWAGLPPPTLQSQGGTKLPAKFDLQTPPGQATDLGGTKALIETGNDNLLTNLNFQATGITSSVVPSWTLGTGVAAAADTSVRYGNDPQSLKLTLTAATGNIISQDVPIGGSVQGTNTEESLYVNSTLTTLEVCARAAGSSLTGVCTAVPSDGLWHPVLSPGQPGTASGSIGVSLYATGSSTGTVNLSRGYVGPARNLGTVAQAQDLGALTISGCSWAGSSTGSLVSLGTTTGCTYSTSSGAQVSAPATMLAAVTVPNKGAGTYQVIVNANIGSNAAADAAYFQLSDGTTNSPDTAFVYGAASSVRSGGINQSIIYSSAPTASTMTIQIYGKTDPGGGAIVAGPVSLHVFYYPPKSQIVQTTDQSDFGWTNVSIAPPSGAFGTVSGGSYQEKRIGDTLYVSGYFTSGTMAAGNMAVPIPGSLTLDTAKMTATANVKPFGDFWRISSGAAINGTSSAAFHGALFWDGSDTSNLYFGWQTASNAFAKEAGNTLANGDSFAFSYAVPVSQWVNTNRAPNLIGSVTSSDPAKSYHDEDGQAGTTAAPCTVSPCSPMTQTGSWVQSSGVTRTSTGVYPVAFTASEFSASPFCSAQCVSNTGCQCQSQSATTSGMTVYCTNTTTAAAMDAAFTFHCKGTR